MYKKIVLITFILPLMSSGLDVAAKNFNGQTLVNQNFKGQDLMGADFTNATLCACDFTGANLNNAKFNGVQIDIGICNETQTATTENPTASLPLQHTLFTGAQLQSADFSSLSTSNRTVIKGAVFNFADLSDSKFSDAELENCSFAFAVLDKANFQSDKIDTDITMCNFECASMQDTMFDKDSLNYQQCVAATDQCRTICKAYASQRPDLTNLQDHCTKLPIDSEPQNDLVADASGCKLQLTGTDWSHIYQAHPYYPYALTSNDSAIWDKVCASCGILTGLNAFGSRFWYKNCVQNCRNEKIAQEQGKKLACPAYDPNQKNSIRLAVIPSEHLFKLGAFTTQDGKSYSYDEAAAACSVATKKGSKPSDACPTGAEVDQVCQQCVADITDGTIDTSLYNSLKNQALTQGANVSFVGDKAQRFTCINQCLASFEKPQHVSWPLRGCKYPSLQFCKDNACTTYRW